MYHGTFPVINNDKTDRSAAVIHKMEGDSMKKYLTFLFILMLFPTYSLADLNNLMWATFPVEKYEYMANEKTKNYKENGQLMAVGSFYISLEKRKVIFNGLILKDKSSDPFNSNSKFKIINEEFELKKIIKLDNQSYSFEGIRQGYFKRKISGKIKLKLNGLSGEVTNFIMNEFGQMYSGVMNRYVILSTKNGKRLLERFQSIDFGNYYAAMGDDSITY